MTPVPSVLSENEVIYHITAKNAEGAEFRDRFQPSAWLCALCGRIEGHGDFTGKNRQCQFQATHKQLQ
ncbi:MAG: hypothetical protein BA871_00175 [Desulfuromonadales bacterium C00003096]|nr:MAG: hypothetical protein BA871_00175 [Desulfuromonadales bacterium C00003096]